MTVSASASASVPFRRRAARAAVVAAALALASMGSAQAQSTAFSVKLTVTASCAFTGAATDVQFPNQVSTSTPVSLDNTSGSLKVTCTPGLTYHIGLDGGANNTGGTYTTTPAPNTRRMRLGTSSNYVAYDLYKTATRAAADFWGNEASNYLTPAVATGTEVTHQIYGRVVNVNVPAGSYQDTVNATITF